MLSDILPDSVRKTSYIVYAIGVVLLGVAAIVLGELELQSQLYDIAEKVWLYLGAAVGAVAAGNTPAKGRYEAKS